VSSDRDKEEAVAPWSNIDIPSSIHLPTFHIDINTIVTCRTSHIVSWSGLFTRSLVLWFRSTREHEKNKTPSRRLPARPRVSDQSISYRIISNSIYTCQTAVSQSTTDNIPIVNRDRDELAPLHQSSFLSSITHFGSLSTLYTFTYFVSLVDQIYCLIDVFALAILSIYAYHSVGRCLAQ